MKTINTEQICDKQSIISEERRVDKQGLGKHVIIIFFRIILMIKTVLMTRSRG